MCSLLGMGCSKLLGQVKLGRRAFRLDRKSTRLNSSHSQISYAVFCLKKKMTSLTRIWPPLRKLREMQAILTGRLKTIADHGYYIIRKNHTFLTLLPREAQNEFYVYV